LDVTGYNKITPRGIRGVFGYGFPLISQIYSAGIGTAALSRLPGFIGPVPPPLWIRAYGIVKEIILATNIS